MQGISSLSHPSLTSILDYGEAGGQLYLTRRHIGPGSLLNDEGRLMVLRALLARKAPQLKLLRATARLPGLAQQLSLLLRELQRHQLSEGRLLKLAQAAGAVNEHADRHIHRHPLFGDAGAHVWCLPA